MAKAKIEMTDVKNQFIDSYTLSTAQSILKPYDIEISPSVLKNYLSESGFFYKGILQASANNLLNILLIAQSQDLQAYTQNDISTMSYAHYAYMSKREIQIASPFQTELEFLQVELETNSNTLSDYKNLQKEINTKLKQEIPDKIQAWRLLQTDHATQLIDELTQQGIQISDKFKSNLIKHLELQGSTNAMPTEMIKKYKIKNPSKTLMALITSLLTDNAKIDITKIVNQLQPSIDKIDKTNQNFIRENAGVFLEIVHRSKAIILQLTELTQKSQILMDTVIALKDRAPKEVQRVVAEKLTEKPQIISLPGLTK